MSRGFIRFLATLSFVAIIAGAAGFIIGIYHVTGWDYAIGFGIGCVCTRFDMWVKQKLAK